VIRYFKLVLMELQRFWKIYAALAALTIVSQVGGLWISIRIFMNHVKWEMELTSLPTYSEFAEHYGRISFLSVVSYNELLYTGPVAVCIVTLLLYVFMIWYRDWYGKNTFIYRLLMLPSSRMNLFWSKLTAIMLFVLGLVSLQIVMLPLQVEMYRQMIPAELGYPESIFSFARRHVVLQILIPPHAADFFLNYGLGFVGVTVVFTAILMERSWRLKGLIAGILYTLAALLAMTAPLALDYILYPHEIFGLMGAAGCILFFVSVWISRMLLAKKITV
jgi:hypothetical protein